MHLYDITLIVHILSLMPFCRITTMAVFMTFFGPKILEVTKLISLGSDNQSTITPNQPVREIGTHAKWASGTGTTETTNETDVELNATERALQKEIVRLTATTESLRCAQRRLLVIRSRNPSVLGSSLYLSCIDDPGVE